MTAQIVGETRKAFVQLVEPYRRQIKAHCYRMSGSLHDADDLVQETFLRAWRAFDKIEDRTALRAWLYQIATRVCLDAIGQRKRLRRVLPQVEFSPASDFPRGDPPVDIAWLEPYPDSELEQVADDSPNPETRYQSHEAVRLAFIAAIQHLPARQRAFLLLVDVLGWTTAEAASLIGGTTASVNSALQRARATLARLHPEVSEKPLPSQNGHDILLDRYVRAWEAKDLDGFVTLLKEEATYAMPPWTQWYASREAIRTFFGTVWQHYGRFRLLATHANRQPAFAVYAQSKHGGPWRAHSLQLLSIENGGISNLTAFLKPMGPKLFDAFGLPSDFADG